MSEVNAATSGESTRIRDRMSGTNSKSACWYLIQCKPRQDERAEHNLRNQQFVCYRPTHGVDLIRRGRRVQQEESLFPGYLFIRLDRMQDNWFAIRSTRGVARLVTFGQEPTRIPLDIIHAIKAHADLPPACASLCQGDRVRITEGPFSELEAIFMRADGEERVILLLNLLHREQRIKVPLRSIQQLSSGGPSGHLQLIAPRYVSRS